MLLIAYSASIDLKRDLVKINLLKAALMSSLTCVRPLIAFLVMYHAAAAIL